MNALRESPLLSPPSHADCAFCAFGRTLTLQHSMLDVPESVAFDDRYGQDLWWSGYEWHGDRVTASRLLLPATREHSLGFGAVELRPRGEVTWGRLAIGYDGHELAWMVLCLDWPDHRNQLADAAYDALVGLQIDARWIVTRAELRRYLSLFCAGLWDAWDSRPLPRRMAEL
jgi:hypothetical protein